MAIDQAVILPALVAVFGTDQAAWTAANVKPLADAPLMGADGKLNPAVLAPALVKELRKPAAKPSFDRLSAFGKDPTGWLATQDAKLQALLKPLIPAPAVATPAPAAVAVPAAAVVAPVTAPAVAVATPVVTPTAATVAAPPVVTTPTPVVTPAVAPAAVVPATPTTPAATPTPAPAPATTPTPVATPVAAVDPAAATATVTPATAAPAAATPTVIVNVAAPVAASTPVADAPVSTTPPSTTPVASLVHKSDEPKKGQSGWMWVALALGGLLLTVVCSGVLYGGIQLLASNGDEVGVSEAPAPKVEAEEAPKAEKPTEITKSGEVRLELTPAEAVRAAVKDRTGICAACKEGVKNSLGEDTCDAVEELCGQCESHRIVERTCDRLIRKHLDKVE